MSVITDFGKLMKLFMLTEYIHNNKAISANDSIDTETVINEFIRSQDIRPSSRKTYAAGLRRFFRWVTGSRRNLNNMTVADIVGYKDFLLNEGISPLTVSSYIVSVRRFYEWIESTGRYPNIAKSVKVPKRVGGFLKQHLTIDEGRKLLQYLKEKGNKRNLAMINLILHTGLRTIEVARANVKDITVKRGKTILKVWGKGHDTSDTIVVLTDGVYALIQEYLEERPGLKDTDPLFVTDGKGHRQGRMATRTIQKICKDSLEAIGLTGHEYSAHSLRHTAAVTLLLNGATMLDVQRVLRHQSINTSQIYTASIEGDLRIDQAPEEILRNTFRI